MLDEIKAALAAATPGPWKATTWINTEGGWAAVGPLHDTEDESDDDQCVSDGCEPNCRHDQDAQADAHLIAMAPQWLAGLVAHIESQEFRRQCADTPLMREVMDERDALRAEVENVTRAAGNWQRRAQAVEPEVSALEAERDALREILQGIADLRLMDGTAAALAKKALAEWTAPEPAATHPANPESEAPCMRCGRPGGFTRRWTTFP